MTSHKNTNWLAVLLLWGVGLLAAAQFARMAVLLPDIGERFGVGEGRAALAISAVGIAGLLFGSTAGAVIARIGAKRALLWALSAAAILVAVQATVDHFAVLLALRLAEGGAHLTIVISAPVLMIAATATRHQTHVMGLWGTFFGVGFALTAVLAPMAANLWGLPGAMLAHAGLLACAAVAVTLLVAPAMMPAGKSRGFLAEHVAILSSPRILAPGLGFLPHTLMFLALLTFLPGLVAPGQGWLSGALPLVALVGTLGAGALARRIAPQRITATSFLITGVLALALIVLPESARLPLALLMIAVVGFAPGACFAAIPILNATPQDQARAGGALSQTGNIGTTLGPPLFALVLSFAGLGGVAILTATICLAGAALLIWIYARIVSIAPITN